MTSHPVETHRATVDDPTWRDLDWVEKFTTQWHTRGTPPVIADFLPDAITLRRAALLQLIKVDIEQRWLRTGHPKLLTDYCADYPELTRDEVPPELIRDEITLRRNSGQVVDPATYLREYPTQATRLEQLLDIGDATVRSPVPPPGAADALAAVDVGQHIDDFDLLTCLGTGAFARVFLARQRSMQRLVAVKISRNRGTEPQTLAQLDHDYIVRVFDQRVVAERDLRLLYMQYLPGGTLLDVMRTLATSAPEERSGSALLDAIDATLADKGEIRPTDSSVRAEIAPLSWPETVAWLGRRLAEALDYADRRHVLHRDVKPANILLTAEGVPKLADFNISFAATLADTSPVSYFGGSLAYMSPEQLAACHPDDPCGPADLDTRSDIYALGVVLWELLTSRKPFPTGDEQQLAAMLAERRDGVGADAIARLPADTPVSLRRILLTCLQPDPRDRWATGAELAQQFDICLNPPARELVDPPPGSWRYRLRPWSILIMELGVTVPNALASVLNWYIIRMLAIGDLGPAAQHRFDLLWLFITAGSFPIGALLILYMRRYLVLVPHGLRKGKTYDAAILARTRTDAILLADRVVAALCGIWIVCAIAWAVSMRILIPGVSGTDYLEFFASVLICTTIAVTYPYFLVAYYAIRCLYPTFLPHGEVPGTDSVRMRRVRVRSVRYLAVAAAIPLVGVAAATFVPLDEIGSVIVAIRIVCIGGVAAFMGAYWLFRKVEGDLATLEGVTSERTEPMKDV